MSRLDATAQPSGVSSFSQTQTGAFHGPTVEQAVYGLLLLLALFLRLFQLGAASPLTPEEAALAWNAWLGVGGETATAAASSPLLYTGQRFLLWLTDGGSDAWVRFLPGLAGSLLVLVAWRLREQLGKPAALVLALLLAVDPWLLTFSRTGDSPILSAALALLLLAHITRPTPATPGERLWLAVAAGLFLVSGPLAWLLLPVLMGALVLFPGRGLWPGDQREQARLLSLVGGAVLAGATGLLSNWNGLGNISASLTVALGRLGGEGGYSPGWAFLRLAADQPLLWTLGLAGLISLWLPAVRAGEGGGGFLPRPWLLLLTGWSVWGIVLLLLPGRVPASLLVLGLPLLLLAAAAGARLLAYGSAQPNWQDGSLIAGSLSVLLVTSALWTAYYSEQWGGGGFDPFTLLFYALVPLLALFFVWWAGWDTSSRVFVLLGTGLLFLASLSSGWSLNLPGQTSRGTALTVETARPGIRALAGDVHRLSMLRALDPDEAPVTVRVAPTLQPLVGWYLRSMRHLRFVDAIDPNALADPAALVITGSDEQVETLSLPAGYVGSRYPVLQRWSPVELSGFGPRIRWVALRELRMNPPIVSLVLWAREE